MKTEKMIKNYYKKTLTKAPPLPEAIIPVKEVKRGNPWTQILCYGLALCLMITGFCLKDTGPSLLSKQITAVYNEYNFTKVIPEGMDKIGKFMKEYL